MTHRERISESQKICGRSRSFLLLLGDHVLINVTGNLVVTLYLSIPLHACVCVCVCLKVFAWVTAVNAFVCVCMGILNIVKNMDLTF